MFIIVDKKLGNSLFLELIFYPLDFLYFEDRTS